MKTLLLVLGLTMPALTGHGVAVEFSTVESDGQRFTVCQVNVRKEKLELFHRDENGQPFKKFDRLAPWVESKGRKLVFAMNAGMFHSDSTTVGLFVSHGRQVSPLNTADGKGNFFLKPNGVFAVTEAGACVVESSKYPQIKGRVLLATQSGPLLVQGGKLHPAFNAGAPSRLLRNGVSVPSPDIALFVISDTGVNFHTFATLFRDKLHCPDALFLDGNISSLYAPALKRSDSRPELGPFIGVTE
ncbi:MAG: hypothetical protein EOP86_24145 [Verrucomicrobiaceae bacterium]|nr:MAG: hypothetical protein EOP86_24145 [Verrucomicrobiaceae bacterium]